MMDLRFLSKEKCALVGGWAQWYLKQPNGGCIFQSLDQEAKDMLEKGLLEIYAPTPMAWNQWYCKNCTSYRKIEQRQLNWVNDIATMYLEHLQREEAHREKLEKIRQAEQAEKEKAEGQTQTH